MSEIDNNDISRAWASGSVMGAGYTFFIVGMLTFGSSIDPVGSIIVGALLFVVGWLLKLSVGTRK